MEVHKQPTIEAGEGVFRDISNEVGGIQTSMFVSTEKKHNLIDEERQPLYQVLLIQVKDPKPPHVLVRGSLSKVTNLFGIICDTISTIWKRGQRSLAEGHIAAVVSSKR